MSGGGHCFHCGGPLGDAPLSADVAGGPRPFCGPDCLAVAQRIHARGLDEFYRFRVQPTGTAKAEDTRVARWAAYDRDGLQREFVSELPGGSRRAQLLLDGVRCAACGWLIENALATVPGVESIRVDPVTARAELQWDPQRLRLSEALAQLARLGYRPSPYTADATDAQARDEQRSALKRLIVAGLGMMQVLSFAVALYAGAWREPEYQAFLRFVSLLVATPVVFYAGAPFFVGAWRRLRAGALGMDVPVAIAIGAAWAASVWNSFRGGGEVYFDSATMFVFFLSAARFLEMSGRHRALGLTAALARHLPKTATRLRGGRTEEVAVLELEPGDRVRVQPGQALPADGRLLSGRAELDESLLTGESRPVSRRAGEVVAAGSLARHRPLELEVTAVGADTLMAQIARLVGDARERKPRLAALADRVAGQFVGGVLLAAALTGIAWWQLAPERAFETVLAVLVVTCPCALALATPAALTVATAALARAGVLLRRGDALEGLARASDVVFDKTGTLTEPGSDLAGLRRLREELDEQSLLEAAAALEAQSEHPLARAFPPPPDGLQAAEVEVFPGRGLSGRVAGRRWWLGSRAFIAEVTGQEPLAPATARPSERPVFLADERGPVAMFLLSERLRPGAAAAVERLRRLGLRLHIASGDGPGPVAALARRLGIDDWHAALRPEDKLRLVEIWQSEGRRVVMLGDGINDSPVLAGADVSIAMGAGTSLAQHSADCVLMGEDLGALAQAFTTARRCLRVVRQNLGWALLYNLVALPLAASGQLSPWMAALGMSASSLLVTGNALRLGRSPRQRESGTTESAGGEQEPDAAWTSSST